MATCWEMLFEIFSFFPCVIVTRNAFSLCISGISNLTSSFFSLGTITVAVLAITMIRLLDYIALRHQGIGNVYLYSYMWVFAILN